MQLRPRYGYVSVGALVQENPHEQPITVTDSRSARIQAVSGLGSDYLKTVSESRARNLNQNAHGLADWRIANNVRVPGLDRARPL
jgi:uncharacterized membrane protein